MVWGTYLEKNCKNSKGHLLVFWGSEPLPGWFGAVKIDFQMAFAEASLFQRRVFRISIFILHLVQHIFVTRLAFYSQHTVTVDMGDYNMLCSTAVRCHDINTDQFVCILCT